MRIVILGTRGVPASYGGFETFAEQLSTRLVARGHEVTVYCRAHYVSPRQIEYKGVRLKVLPTIRHKYFDTIVHTGLSAFHAAAVRRFDAALICNAANAPFAPVLRAGGTPVAINVDGLEHKRKKWNWMGRSYYLLAERLAVWLPNETVTDGVLTLTPVAPVTSQVVDSVSSIRSSWFVPAPAAEAPWLLDATLGASA